MTVERTTTFEALEHRFDVVVENLPGTAEYLQGSCRPWLTTASRPRPTG